MSEWISVKDKLPEFGDQVLIYIGSQMTVAEYTKGMGFICAIERDMFIQDYITHWQKLPEPPK